MLLNGGAGQGFPHGEGGGAFFHGAGGDLALEHGGLHEEDAEGQQQRDAGAVSLGSHLPHGLDDKVVAVRHVEHGLGGFDLQAGGRQRVLLGFDGARGGRAQWGVDRRAELLLAVRAELGVGHVPGRHHQLAVSAPLVVGGHEGFGAVGEEQMPELFDRTGQRDVQHRLALFFALEQRGFAESVAPQRLFFALGLLHFLHFFVRFHFLVHFFIICLASFGDNARL